MYTIVFPDGTGMSYPTWGDMCSDAIYLKDSEYAVIDPWGNRHPKPNFEEM